MLDKARDRAFYTELRRGDLIEVLGGLGKTFSLFFAADVLVYIGDLEPLFRACRAASRDGAVCCVSTEALLGADAKTPFRLNPTGRYAHSEAYVREVAGVCGFVVKRMETAVIRHQGAEDVKGHLVVLEARPRLEEPPGN
jgi:predicted TPR repeat methyltransferase